MKETTRNVPTTPQKKKINHIKTPRKRKSPVGSALYGLRNLGETVESVGRRVSMRLNLAFQMDDWQSHIIHRIRQGYDSIVVAGTGYGKSLIFQGLAVLEPKKILTIISPLKALERNQVAEAEAKGLKAVMINENTVCSDLWSRLRQGKDHLYYVSPEMALSVIFLMLWQDISFRNRVEAVIVDEAHCIVKWGDNFHKEYSGLSRLRDYIGQAVPMVACTATCSTKTFNILWTSLKFGHQPFWGLDAGCDRGNLTYLIRPLENTKNPVLDILNILPPVIPPKSDPTIIPKCILYFETLAECTNAMETLRKVLPESLRQTVQTFVGLTSEAGKEQIWQHFKHGDIRILCATDAAGMGCNVPDIKFVALFCVPWSMSILAQHWGRAGRDRSLHGTCFLFAQSWAFRPKGEPRFTSLGKPKPLETKTSKTRREKLEWELENVINLGFDSSNQDCVHRYLQSHFWPETELHTFKTLHQVYDAPHRKGSRSLKSTFQLSWTQLSLNREAPEDQCCSTCVASLLAKYMPPSRNNPRLSAYLQDFIYPLQISNHEAGLIPQRPHSSSVSSNSSASTTSSNVEIMGNDAIAVPMSQAVFVPLKHRFSIPESERKKLKEMLKCWREENRLEQRGEFSLLSSKVDLPYSAIKKLVEHGGDFLRTPDITPLYLKKIVQLDLASPSTLRGICNTISEWRQKAALNVTPGRPKKVCKKVALEIRAEVQNDSTPHPTPRPLPHRSSTPLPQPVFTRVGPTAAGHPSTNTDVFSGANIQAPIGITLSGTQSTSSVPEQRSEQEPHQEHQLQPLFLFYPPMVYPHLGYYPTRAYHNVFPPHAPHHVFPSYLPNNASPSSNPPNNTFTSHPSLPPMQSQYYIPAHPAAPPGQGSSQNIQHTMYYVPRY